MKIKKATPLQESSLQNNQCNNSSTAVQRARVLEALEQAGSKGLSTIQLREGFDIMSPAPRILELREADHRIETIWTVTENAQGHKHRCARYVFLPNNVGVTA